MECWSCLPLFPYMCNSLSWYVKSNGQIYGCRSKLCPLAKAIEFAFEAPAKLLLTCLRSISLRVPASCELCLLAPPSAAIHPFAIRLPHLPDLHLIIHIMALPLVSSHLLCSNGVLIPETAAQYASTTECSARLTAKLRPQTCRAVRLTADPARLFPFGTRSLNNAPTSRPRGQAKILHRTYGGTIATTRQSTGQKSAPTRLTHMCAWQDHRARGHRNCCMHQYIQSRAEKFAMTASCSLHTNFSKAHPLDYARMPSDSDQIFLKRQI